MKLKATIVILSSLLLSVWLMSCIDVSSTGIPPELLKSEFRFVNAAADAGNVSFSFDLAGQPAVNDLGFGEANSHQTYDSGSRNATLSNGDSFIIAMTAEQRATVVLLPMTLSTREFVKVIERDTFVNPSTLSTGIRVVHAALAGAVAGGDLDVTVTSADASFTSLVMTLSYRGQSPYASVPAGSYTVTVTASGDTTVVGTTTVDFSFRATSVIIGDVSAPSFANLADN